MSICLTDFRNAVKDFMTGDDSDAILKELNDRAEAHMRKRLMPKAEAMNMAVDDLIKENKIRAKMKQIEYKENVIKRRAAEEQIEEFKNDYSEGLASFFTGTSVKGDRSRLSVAGNRKIKGVTVMSFLKRELDKRGALEAFNNKDLDYKIAMERSGIDTGDANAKMAAEAVNETYKYLRKEFNLNRIYIPNTEGYIAKLSHNTERMISPTGNLFSDIAMRTRLFAKYAGDFHRVEADLKESAFQRWKDTIMPLTDIEKTFKTVKPGDEDKFFRSMYDALVSGIRKDMPKEHGSVQLRQLRKGYNIADKLRAERTWHPKDADSWYQYNKQFGYGSFHDAALAQISQMSQALATIEKMGSNPRSFADQLIRKYEPIIIRDQKTPGHTKRLRDVKNFIDYILGDMGRPSHGLGSKIVSSFKTLQYFRLGSIIVRSVPDLNYMGLAMKPYGESVYGTAFNVMSSFIKGLPKGEMKEVAHALGVYADGSLGTMFDRWGNPDIGFGVAARGLQLQDKLSLINRWDARGRDAMAFTVSRRMGELVGGKYEAIPEEMRRILRTYGIDEDVWDLVGGKRNRLTRANNTAYFTPDIVNELTNEEIATKYYKNKTGTTSELKFEQAKSDIKNRLMNFFHDQMNNGKVFPNESDFAYIKARTPHNPFLGGLWNVLTMFRSFDVAATRRTWGSFLYSENTGSIARNMWMRRGDVGRFMMGSAVYGMMSYTASELLHGRIPNFKNPKVWLEAAILGGAFGVYGGFLESFMNGNDNTLQNLAGPAIGSMTDIAKLGIHTLEGKNTKNQLVNFLYYHLPMANLFYIKPILDRTLFHAMHDAVDPNYMAKRRMNARRNAMKNGSKLLWLP